MSSDSTKFEAPSKETSLHSLYFDSICKVNQYAAGSLDLTQKDIKELVKNLSVCSQQIHSLRLFSTEETLQDVDTQYLPYFLVDTYVADTMLKLNTTGLNERSQLVKRAQAFFQSFLTQCEFYDLISPSELRYSKKISNPGLPPAERRNLKISRLKESKERDQALGVLQSKLIYLLCTKSSSHNGVRRRSIIPSSFLSSFNVPSNMPDEVVSVDDEEVFSRDFCIHWIQKWISNVIDELTTLEDELKHLEFALKKEETSQTSSICLSEKIDFIRETPSWSDLTPLLNTDGKPLRPFSIISRHAQLQQVFRAGHQLPTMTIDEYVEAERARGGILPSAENHGQGLEIPNSDSEPETDEKLIKIRKWDEFKEDNPRGWGNKGGNRG